MAEAFLDTTILTNVLLKRGPEHDACVKALARYSATALPTYAIKEFKAGPLGYFVWAHNKLANTSSLAKTMSAIAAVIPRQPGRAATGLRAISDMIQSHRLLLEGLRQKYGGDADPDRVTADRVRYSLRRRIMEGWNRRRQVATAVVGELDCYAENAPFATREGLIDLNGKVCRQGGACAMAEAMGNHLDWVTQLRDAILAQPPNRENQRRADALEQILRTKHTEFDESHCRALGDAVFAFLCPDGTEILTTNLKDLRPLASALDKKVATP